LPGTTAPLAPLPSSPSGNIAPAASPLPPISPLPANPSASPPPRR
jgi:hypothetical protein